jgi:hypothetical protein
MRRWVAVSIAVTVLVIAGCAASPQPFVYHDDRDEKPGPGLFSGEAGGFVIYGDSVEKHAAGDTQGE